MKKKSSAVGTKISGPVLPQDSKGNFTIVIGPPPDLAKKKKKKIQLQTAGETLIYTDEEILFSVQKPVAGNFIIKVEAYLANINVSSGKLALSLLSSTPATAFFSVPYGSGYFDGNEAITLENEWTTIPFELNGAVFEEEEIGNILLLILIRGTNGTTPNQTVYQGGIIYNVASPYSASKKKKAAPKKRRKA